MDLRLKEITWVRLLSLLIWTILVMVKRGVSQLIDAIESKVFDKSEQTLSEEIRERGVGCATLLPPLSDDLVLTRIWPLLQRRVNVSLMWRLRRVSRAWKRSVSMTLEWAALEVVHVDSHGYTRYLKERCESRPSLHERVEDELRSITVLLSERLSNFAPQSAVAWSRVEDREQVDKDEDLFADSVEDGCALSWSRNPCTERLWGLSENDWEHNEGEEIWETDDSSSGSSMRVYFPRHQLRV